jgi:hypothetical protein
LGSRKGNTITGCMPLPPPASSSLEFCISCLSSSPYFWRRVVFSFLFLFPLKKIKKKCLVTSAQRFEISQVTNGVQPRRSRTLAATRVVETRPSCDAKESC